MKKLIILILAAMMLSSCGGRGENPGESGSTETKPTGTTNVADIPIEQALVVPDEKLTEEFEAALKKKFPDTFKGDVQWATVDKDGNITLGYYCYGVFNGCLVYFEQTQTRAEHCVAVAGSVFAYPSGFAIDVCKDGSIYTIEEAYKNGLVTENDIKLAVKRHKAVTDSIFGEGAHDDIVSRLRD